MLRKRFSVLASLAVCALLVGCGGEADHGDHAAEVAGHDEGDGHAHEGDHDHDALGPHGGHVIVLGEEEYHAELTHDEASHTVAVYLLDGEVKEPVTSGPTEVVLQVFQDGDFVDYTLAASGDPGGYALADEALCDLLAHSETLKGRIRVQIGDKEYVGIVEHTAHEHH